MNIPLTAKTKADISAIRTDLKRHMLAQPIAGEAAKRALHNILKNADNLLAAIERAAACLDRSTLVEQSPLLNPIGIPSNKRSHYPPPGALRDRSTDFLRDPVMLVKIFQVPDHGW